MLKNSFNATFLFISAILIIATAGCYDENADQTIVKPEHQKLANPDPTARNFAAINKRHKILMAAFDSGVDYNHPELVNNVHFDLDSKGKPVGLGKDYLANDNWSSYRIVATNRYYFKDLGAERKQEVLQSETEESYNQKVDLGVSERDCQIKALLQVDKRLSKYIDPYRLTVAEAGGDIIHGTHVAGLMTYDRPDFGFVAYRILPYHQNQQDKKDANIGKADKFAENFADAVEDASKKGIKIINLSIGGSLERPDEDSSQASQADTEKFNNLSKVITERLAGVIKSHPQMLFVAAAGNDSGWSDNDSRVQFPCGIEAENILCVGATNKYDKITTFSNVPLNNIDLVFAPGSNIKSLAPSDRCPSIDTYISAFMGSDSGTGAVCSYDSGKKAWDFDEKAMKLKSPMMKQLYATCADKSNQYISMSGTSMATPITSHIAAEIWVDHPEITQAKDIIALIEQRANKVSSKSFTRYILQAKKPSWYGPTDGVSKSTMLTRADGATPAKKVTGMHYILGHID